ncbi:P52 family lipoprotein [Borreliella valaisiana]|uniref:P52 family lipoprotein n=1 Tax=Borreliella valaisiana TaxID=62088 RepID=UPI002ED083A0|nr:P52 family lipoprotein [Borreliella valaisiana]
MNLGSRRSKELINLFGKIKIEISNKAFEVEVFLLYFCIEEVCLVNLLYFDGEGHICSDEEGVHVCFDSPVPSINQQFKKIRKSLEKTLKDFGVFL